SLSLTFAALVFFFFFDSVLFASFFSFFFYSSFDLRDLHSFPTRRSSDLVGLLAHHSLNIQSYEVYLIFYACDVVFSPFWMFFFLVQPLLHLLLKANVLIFIFFIKKCL